MSQGGLLEHFSSPSEHQKPILALAEQIVNSKGKRKEERQSLGKPFSGELFWFGFLQSTFLAELIHQVDRHNKHHPLLLKSIRE